MPELPDIVVYIECLCPKVEGQTLDGIRLTSPFLLHSVEPPLSEARGRRVVGLRRLGKRIIFALEPDHIFARDAVAFAPDGHHPHARLARARLADVINQTAGMRAWDLWRSQIRAQVNW